MIGMSEDPKLSGILVQLPMPAHINSENVLRHIPPEKDVDGLHPFNMGSLAMKNQSPYFICCTPLACQLSILHAIQKSSSTPHAFEDKKDMKNPLEGANICILGRSNIVGMPLFLLLQKYHNAQVTLCHSRTPEEELIRTVQRADILVSCIGIPNFVQPFWIKPGCIVIDVGITYADVDETEESNQVDSSRQSMMQKKEIFGDVTFNEETLERVSLITPVPGGIGPITITMLLNNLEEGWIRQNFDLQINRRSSWSKMSLIQ